MLSDVFIRELNDCSIALDKNISRPRIALAVLIYPLETCCFEEFNPLGM